MDKTIFIQKTLYYAEQDDAISVEVLRLVVLLAGVDIHQTLPEELQSVYDVAVCVGVFTPGHVLPEALYQLIDMTRPGGLTIVSTRVPYYEMTDFQQVSDRIEAEGIAVLKKFYRNAPYRDDGDAHYWIYERLNGENDETDCAGRP